MEIMTTWNTDFEFDLQRFAAVAVTFSDGTTTSANVGIEQTDPTGYLLYTVADGKVTYSTTDTADGSTIYKLATTANGAITWTAANNLPDKTFTATFSAAYAANIGTGNAKVLLADSNGSFSAATGTATYTANGFKLSGTLAVEVVSGTPAFAGQTTGAVTFGTKGVGITNYHQNSGAVSTDVGTITVTDDSTDSTYTVTKAGAVSDLNASDSFTLKDGATVLVTATSDTTGTGVTFGAKGTGEAAKISSVTGKFTIVANDGANNKINILGKATAADAAAQATCNDSAVTLNKGTFTSVADSTAVDTSVTGSGDVIIGNYKFVQDGVNDTAKGAYASTGLTLSQGLLEVAAGTSSATVVNKATFTNADPSVPLQIASNDGSSDNTGIFSGSINAVVGTEYRSMKVSATKYVAGDAVIVTSSVDGVVVAQGATPGETVVTGLDKVGESVAFTNKTTTGGNVTYEVTSLSGTNVIVKATDSSGTKYYKRAANAAWADDVTAYAGDAVSATAIDTAKYTKTTYFNSFGIETASTSSDKAATLTVNGTSRSLEVTAKIDNGVNATGDTVTVTDKSTDTEYTLAKSSVVTAKGGTFTVTDGVVSNATGTMTMTAAATNFTAKGTVNVDASLANAAATTTTPVLTYNAGESINGAKVTIGTDKYFTLTENNSGDTAENTVINLSTGVKTITGVDAEATIKTNGIGVADIASISTTGSGTFTFNKTSCVVADDSNGVTFGVGATDTITEIANLDREATVKISSKLSGATLTVGAAGVGTTNTTFSDINAKNGATFTSINTAGAASVTLFAKGDSVADAGGTPKYYYTVDAMGSANDGVVVGKNTTGTLAALNDGDKITVVDNATTPTKSYTYEVSGNLLVVTDNITSANTKTYTLSDSNDTGFTVSDVLNPFAAATKINGDKGVDTENVTFGTAVGVKPTSSLTDGVFVNADGSLTTNGDKAVAKIGLENDVVTYTSQSSKAQVVNVTKSSDNWNVTTGAGKDEISFTGANVKSDVSINSGAGDDTITSSGTGDVLISAGDGKDSVLAGGSGDVQVSLGGGNDTITATGSGDLIIYGESGNNLINASAATGSVSIAGGSGNDTITAKSADDVVYGGDGKDVFDIRTKSVKISDYSFENDVVYVAGTTFGVNDEGKIATSGGTADISATAGDYYTAQINVGGTKSQNWAWAKDGGSTIDITSFEKNAHLQGDGDGANVLYAGSGDDYIYSYSEKDSVYGGAGKDSIVLSTASDDINRVVGVATTSGKDTVSGFKTGFSDGDSIFMVDGSASDVKASFDSSKSQVTFKDGSSSLQLDSIAAGKSGAVELKVGDTKLAVLAEGAKATVDSASYADVFYGNGSAVDFSAVDEALSVNLSNSLSAGGEGTKFVGVSSIVGGKGANTLMGSAKADSIVAGTGKSSLYGGAGADTLVGNSAEGDVFFFGAGTNTNTITTFMTADKETADTVKILGDVTSAKFANNAIELGTTDSSKAVIKSLASGSINANTMVKVDADNFKGIAKIGASSTANNFTYDKTVGYYGGGSQSDKLSVASNYADNAEVWLDGSKGTAYASLDVVDFSNGTGNYVLAGDSSKQVIVGGKGENSLWGGAGNVADSIKGGAGTNTFFYGLGEGNDTISSSNTADTVNLYNISLSDVKAGEITNAGVMVEMNDGSTLAVATGKDITFKLASGETYVANHTSKGWDKA